MILQNTVSESQWLNGMVECKEPCIAARGATRPFLPLLLMGAQAGRRRMMASPPTRTLHTYRPQNFPRILCFFFFYSIISHLTLRAYHRKLSCTIVSSFFVHLLSSLTFFSLSMRISKTRPVRRVARPFVRQTIDCLVAASNLPLSVVIVGVGQADFSVSFRPRRCCFSRKVHAPVVSLP